MMISALMTSACFLVVAFDYEVNVPNYAVRGTVSGLEEGRRVTLRINQGAGVEYSDNSAFSIPSAVADKTDYLVTAVMTSGDPCEIDRPSGRVEGGDVVIAVACPSSNVALSEVRVRDGIVEASGPTSFRARLSPRAALLTGAGIATEVTAIAANPKAALTIAGVGRQSGEAHPLTIGDASFTFAIDVAAAAGARASYVVDATPRPTYVKRATLGSTTDFGRVLAVDGDTVAIGSNDASCATGSSGDPNSNAGGCPDAGAVHVFRRIEGTWRVEAYLKPSNTKAGLRFGSALALRGDTLVVGAPNESSSAIGIGGDQTSTATKDAGAVYVFLRRSSAGAAVWTQEAYIKRSVVLVGGRFGISVAFENEHLAIASETAPQVEMFRRSGGTTWMSAGAPLQSVDSARALAIDGGASTLVVGRRVFRRNDADVWSEEATIPLPPVAGACFGCAVAIAKDTLVIGAPDASDGSVIVGGAYVYRRTGAAWSLEDSLRASNPRRFARFGASVAIDDENAASIVVGDDLESSGATGVDGNAADESVKESGAVYIFRRSSGGSKAWVQTRYLKPPNTFAGAGFGISVMLRSSILAVGAPREASAALGIDGDPSNTSLPNGAAYVW